MNYANQVKETLLSDISDMAKFPWLFSVNPHSDFTRVSKLDFLLYYTFVSVWKAEH